MGKDGNRKQTRRPNFPITVSNNTGENYGENGRTETWRQSYRESI